MKDEAAPASCRGRAAPEGAVPAPFVHQANTVAVRHAARDAHRSECDRGSVECATCREYADVKRLIIGG